jgi:zinc protease
MGLRHAENGLRWAVRANSVPPGQVSIRIRMDVGSFTKSPKAGLPI